MFLLDTNVLSAMMNATPVVEVRGWMSRQLAESLFTASVCQAEILSGLAVMPLGRRRLQLEASARAVFMEDFAGRVLPFDGQAAVAYAEIFATRRGMGRPVSAIDLMIASVARSRGLCVVTRNVADFSDCGVAVIDPWNPSG
jgi:hypothetical protein